MKFHCVEKVTQSFGFNFKHYFQAQWDLQCTVIRCMVKHQVCTETMAMVVWQFSQLVVPPATMIGTGHQLEVNLKFMSSKTVVILGHTLIGSTQYISDTLALAALLTLEFRCTTAPRTPRQPSQTTNSTD